MATYFAPQALDDLNAITPPQDIGPIQRRHWNLVVPAGGIAAPSIIVLAKIPAGKRVTGGLWLNTAGGAAATAKVQDYKITDVSATGLGTDSKWGTLTDMTAATSQPFGNTNAKAFGSIDTIDRFLAVLTAAQTIQADAVLSGYVDLQ
jgi:hypothetical protein